MRMLVGEGYGRVVALEGSPEALDAARGSLPFWWVDSEGTPEQVFGLVAPEAVPLIIRNVEGWIAEHACDVVFVHAAAVAVDGRAIVLPGTSFSGKTSLCVELLKRGADFLTDEFSVLDADGRVMPYPRPIHVRGDAGERNYVTPDSLGAMTATGTATVALAALLDYDERGGWSVTPVSPALSVLRLLDHTVCAQSRPEASLDAVTTALSGALCLEGTRGAATEAADLLLAELSRVRTV
jgi:hypothetical protein